MRIVYAIAGCSALTLAACTTLLGNDFTIVDGSGGGGPGQGGAGGGATGGGGSGASSNGGSGGAGGGGGVMGPGPLDCTWIDVEKVADLSSEPAGSDQWGGGRMQMTLTDREVRWIVGRTLASGAQVIELFSANEDNVETSAHGTYTGCYGFARIDGNTTGALLEGPAAGAQGRIIDLMLIDDSDSSGSGATTESIAATIGDVSDYEAAITSAGDGTAAIAYTHRLSGDVHRAKFVRWVNGTGTEPEVEFDNSTATPSLTAGDYEVGFFVRDADGDNHALLGTAFEGATRARHFILPDDVSGMVTPTRNDVLTSTSPILLPESVRRRADDTFLAAYAVFTDPAEVRMGTFPASELDTHAPTDLPVVSTIVSTEVPDETGFDATDNSLLIMGTQTDATLGVRLMLFHKDSGLRENVLLAYPDSGIFPSSYEVQRFNAVFVSDTIDTTFGGEIYAAWYVRDDATSKDSMYLGRVECVPSGG